MQAEIKHLPGYRMNDYQLVLLPQEELRNRIMKVRQEFSDKYKTTPGNLTRAWLPLAYFNQYELMEERLLNRLRTVAMGQYPFRLEFRDFGSFPSHTIFINVPTKVPVQELVRTIRHDIQRLVKPDEEHKPYFVMEPHLSVAMKLKPWQYEKGWLEYSQLHFSGRMIADRMLLMKRRVGEMKWQVLESFLFQNLPVTVKQGELFR